MENSERLGRQARQRNEPVTIFYQFLSAAIGGANDGQFNFHAFELGTFVVVASSPNHHCIAW